MTLRFPALAPSFVAAALLGLAGPVLAGGTQYTTIAAGNWNAPAIWDLGAVPGVGSGDHAWVDHNLVIDSAVPFIDSVILRSPGGQRVVTVLPGAQWTGGALLLGTGFVNVLSLEGGATSFDQLTVGMDATGVLEISGGSLQADSIVIDPATSPGASGAFGLNGGAASVQAGLFHVDEGTFNARPTANGAAGLTVIEAADVVLGAGSRLSVFPTYGAAVGDSWDLIHYTGTLSGSFGSLSAPFGSSMSIDTSTPGVVRAVVTASPYPLIGDTCDNPLPATLGGDVTGTFSFAFNSGPDTVCGESIATVDLWFEVTNDGPDDLCLKSTLLDLNGVDAIINGGLEVWDACGGTALDCDTSANNTDPSVVNWVAPAGSTFLLRVTWSGAGGFPYRLRVELDTGSWTDVGGGSPGVNGVPTLVGSGELCPNAMAGIDLTNAAPSSLALVWISATSSPLDIFGGTLHAFPFVEQVLLGTDAAGAISLTTTWPADLPLATEFWLQFLCEDGTVLDGITLSNALKGVTAGG